MAFAKNVKNSRKIVKNRVQQAGVAANPAREENANAPRNRRASSVGHGEALQGLLIDLDAESRLLGRPQHSLAGLGRIRHERVAYFVRRRLELEERRPLDRRREVERGGEIDPVAV